MEEQYNPYFNPSWRPPNAQGTLTNVNNINRFNIPKMNISSPQVDPNYGRGFSQPNTGFDTAGLMKSAAGAIDLGASIASMDDEAKAIQTNAPAGQYDAFGNPTYNLGEFAIKTNSIRPRGASAGEALSGVGKGAAAGAAFGPWGAAIGGFIGGVGTLLGGRRRKRKMRAAKRKAQRRLVNRQMNYNEESLAARQSRGAMQSYYDQVNNTSRLQNLYGG